MLLKLLISNYALIDELEIDFSNGFTVITGETGAGKSILLGALALILGKRADTQVLMDKSMKCVIEGTFNVKDYDFGLFFASNDIDYEPMAILRREITPAGKSRSFINDTPVPLNTLKELGDRLVDIHSQHRTLTINDADVQMEMVDQFAQNQQLLREYSNLFIQYKELEKEIGFLRIKERESRRDQDYYQFLFDELQAASLNVEEDSGLEAALDLLNNAEDIKTRLFNATHLLEEHDQSIMHNLREIVSGLEKHADKHPVISGMLDRIRDVMIELKDVASEIAAFDASIEYDQGRIETLNLRLDLLNKLMIKHQAEDITALVAVMAGIDNRLLQYSSLEAEIEVKASRLTELEALLQSRAEELHLRRKSVIDKISQGILSILASLGMKEARFVAELRQEDTLGAEGNNTINFLFNANRGGELQPISRVASGGELSRLMLAVKSMVSRQNMIPTLIFDEIDNGVSGDIAIKVAEIMKRMADGLQLIVITHLPQIASKGEHHFLVYKEIDSNFTRSLIKPLSQEERVHELAKMLSGDRVTEAARNTAIELMDNEEQN